MGLGNLYLFIELGMKMVCLFFYNDKTDKRQGFDIFIIYSHISRLYKMYMR